MNYDEVNDTMWSGSRDLIGTGMPLDKYNFPKDPRQIGGAYTVEENAKLLLRYFYFERLLLRSRAVLRLQIFDRVGLDLILCGG